MRRKLRPLARRGASGRSLFGSALAAAFLAVGASAQAAPFVYVTNSLSRDVSQYDVGADGLLTPLSPATVPARFLTLGIAVSPDGQSVYATNNNSPTGTVSQYDVGANGALSPKRPPAAAAGNGPRGVAVSPDGNSVYVSNSFGTISQYSVGADGALSPKSPAMVADTDVGPAGVAVSPDGESVYVVNSGSSVSQYDVGPGGGLSPKDPATVPAGLVHGTVTFGIAVTPNGKSVYVTDTEGQVVSQYDVDAGGRLAPKNPPWVPTGQGAYGVAVSPDGESVYVTSISQGVSQYDVGAGGGLTPKTPPTVAAGEGAVAVAVNPDGRSVYVANSGGTVSQYSVGANGSLSPRSPATVPAGENPSALGIAVSPVLTIITGGPSGVINDPTPTFSFSSFNLGSSFQCKVDSGAYTACSSPKTTSHLTDGPHTFFVRAKDSAGIVDPTPASRTFTVRTASVRVSNSALVVTAAPGAQDNLAISRPSASTVRVTDFPAGVYTGSGVHTGAGCTRSGDYTANCLATAITPVLPALVTSAGLQADKVVNSTDLPSSLYGGGGNDTLTGGAAGDILNGGGGADLLSGMDGNDLLRAHDGTSDQAIDCGGGSDKADLDQLPLDPNSLVKGCEDKTRH